MKHSIVIRLRMAIKPSVQYLALVSRSTRLYIPMEVCFCNSKLVT